MLQFVEPVAICDQFLKFRFVYLKAKILRKSLFIAFDLLVDTLRFHPVECRQVTVQHDLFIPDDKNLSGNRHVLDSGF